MHEFPKTLNHGFSPAQGSPCVPHMYGHYIPYVSLIRHGCTEYSLMEHPWASTPLHFSRLFVASEQFCPSPSQRGPLPSAGLAFTRCSSCLTRLQNALTFSSCLFLSIGQTSPVKSLKPVSRIVSFPLFLLFPKGIYTVNVQNILTFSLFG